MRSKIAVGKTIAGFAYTVSKNHNGDGNERVLIDTFAKTQTKAKAKLVNSKRYFYSKEYSKYRLFSVHLSVMRELELNLDDGMEGFPCLDDDEDYEPPVKTINGRIVIEDPFDLKNPATTTRRKNNVR